FQEINLPRRYEQRRGMAGVPKETVPGQWREPAQAGASGLDAGHLSQRCPSPGAATPGVLAPRATTASHSARYVPPDWAAPAAPPRSAISWRVPDRSADAGKAHPGT